MKYINSKDIQAKLKSIMSTNGLSYKDIAESVNTTPQNIHNILNKKKHISFDDVNLICQALDMQLDYDIKPDIAIPPHATDIQNADELKMNIAKLSYQISELHESLEYLKHQQDKDTIDISKNS